MSDDQQKQNNQFATQPISDSARKPARPTDDPHKQQGQMVSISKEGQPIQIPEESTKSSEVQFSEYEPKTEDADVDKYLKVERDEPEIHPDLKKAGLQAIEHTSLDPRHRVELPLPDEKVLEGLDQPVSSSWRWLSEYAIFILRQGHLTLKRVHGRVIRVIRR